MTTATVYNFHTLPKTYKKLVDILPPRPIESEEQYDEVVRMVHALAGWEGRMTKDQDDYLEALSRFVEDYDEEHYPIPKSTPVRILKFMMEQNDMTPADLGRLLGDKSVGYRVLSGERKLSKSHIKKLSQRFHMDASAFLD